MSASQWFHDPDVGFDLPLPTAVSGEVARFYGTGTVAVDFAQLLAAFLGEPRPRGVLMAALAEPWPTNTPERSHG